MLIDVLVLVMFVDGHLHRPDLGQHHLTEPGLHHQIDARQRVGAQHQLVQLGGHPLGGDAASSDAIRSIALAERAARR